VLTLFLRAFVIQAFRIPSESMMDTLLVGDFLFVNKFEYGPKIPFTHIRLARAAPAAARRRDRVPVPAGSEQGLHQALHRNRRPDARGDEKQVSVTARC
jgi:signal peptidase I